MSNNTREFEIGAVITAATGRLVARDGVSALYEILGFIIGGPVWTHQIPRVINECREGLCEQFPWLRKLEVPEDLGPENCTGWVDDLAAVHGATLMVEAAPPGEHAMVDPISELATMVSPEKIIVVEPTSGSPS